MFLSCQIVNSFILCLGDDEQFGEKAYNFICTCDNHGFVGCFLIGRPFQQAFSVTSISDIIQYALISFPFCRTVQALNLKLVNLTMQCACRFFHCEDLSSVLSLNVHHPSADIKFRFSLGTVKNENVLFYVCLYVCVHKTSNLFNSMSY